MISVKCVLISTALSQGWDMNLYCLNTEPSLMAQMKRPKKLQSEKKDKQVPPLRLEGTIVSSYPSWEEMGE